MHTPTVGVQSRAKAVWSRWIGWDDVGVGGMRWMRWTDRSESGGLGSGCLCLRTNDEMRAPSLTAAARDEWDGMDGAEGLYCSCKSGAV